MSKVNRTLARLRLCRMQMRREGKLLLKGYTPPLGGETDVMKTWEKHGWVRPEWKWDYDCGGWRPRRATMPTDTPVHRRDG